MQNPPAPFASSTIGDRLPPQNIEAERGVLGSMLRDNSQIDECRDDVRPQDFYRDSHQILCEQIYAIHDSGVAVDIVILEEHLVRSGKIDKVGGLDAILTVIDSVPHAANAKEYAGIVRQHAILRDSIESAHEVLRAAYSRQHTGDDVADLAESLAFKVRQDREQRTSITLAEASIVALDEAMAAMMGEFQGLGSGLPDLDELVGGFKGAQLTILGARPSMGKTSLAMNIAEHCIVSEGRSVFFSSLEMGRTELSARYIMSKARVDSQAFRRQEPSPGSNLDRDIARLRATLAELPNLPPLEIDDLSFRTVGQIASAARRFASRMSRTETPLGIIFIDYIQLIRGDNPKSSRQEQISEISARLKGLSKDLNVPVIALSQLNRNVEGRGDHRPMMSDLRESGSLEQDADIVLLLHRPEYYDATDRAGEADIIVGKNRNGCTGSAAVTYLKEFTRFESLANRGHQQEAAPMNGYHDDDEVPFT